ncbi:MAG: zinc-binding dehydrogenase [Rhodospirillaceae bacterium]|jgi:NADPH:quinone reductase|nr:zinc-binding dehydrogenase [Rhodospirillaceae bacterium]
MKGWLVEEFGGPEVMQWADMPDPEPAPDEVVVDVHASGINFAETRMRAGTYTGLGLPIVLGLEGAGVVSAVGANVENAAVGDRVFFRGRGSHATKCAIKAYHAFPMPDHWSFEQGAASGVGWLTAWHALHIVTEARPGQTVLIEAIASSVGTAALQIAKAKGCRVVGTASQDGKLAKAKEYGADAIINYKTEDVHARVMELTEGQGLDIGCMTIGEETASTLINSMGHEGKIAMYGSTGGRMVTFSLNIGAKNIQLLSMSIDTSDRYVPETVPSFRDEALAKFNDGTFKPIIDAVLPVSEVAKAHEMVGNRKHFGKIILSISH